MTADETPPGPVVVGIDGSEESIHALRRATEVAGWRGAPLHVVHVNDITPALLHFKEETVNTRDMVDAHRAELNGVVEEVTRGAGVDVEFVGVDGDHAADALVTYSEEAGASVLVVGPRGRGRVSRALLGSTAHSVVNHAKCDVLVVRPGT